MSFSIDLSRAVKKVKENAEDVVKGTTFQLFTNIVKRTPVGNPSIWQSKPPKGYIGGTLRNSWYCAINNAAGVPKRKPSKSGSESIKSLVAIQNYTLGDSVYLVNRAPYARRVEFGWSSQAPAGMARISLAEVKDVI